MPYQLLWWVVSSLAELGHLSELYLTSKLCTYHNICSFKASSPYEWCDKATHFTLSEVDVKVWRRVYTYLSPIAAHFVGPSGLKVTCKPGFAEESWRGSWWLDCMHKELITWWIEENDHVMCHVVPTVRVQRPLTSSPIAPGHSQVFNFRD